MFHAPQKYLVNHPVLCIGSGNNEFYVQWVKAEEIKEVLFSLK